MMLNVKTAIILCETTVNRLRSIKDDTLLGVSSRKVFSLHSKLVSLKDRCLRRGAYESLVNIETSNSVASIAAL